MVGNWKSILFLLWWMFSQVTESSDDRFWDGWAHWQMDSLWMETIFVSGVCDGDVSAVWCLVRVASLDDLWKEIRIR